MKTTCIIGLGQYKTFEAYRTKLPLEFSQYYKKYKPICKDCFDSKFQKAYTFKFNINFFMILSLIKRDFKYETYFIRLI